MNICVYVSLFHFISSQISSHPIFTEFCCHHRHHHLLMVKEVEKEDEQNFPSLQMRDSWSKNGITNTCFHTLAGANCNDMKVAEKVYKKVFQLGWALGSNWLRCMTAIITFTICLHILSLIDTCIPKHLFPRSLSLLYTTLNCLLSFFLFYFFNIILLKILLRGVYNNSPQTNYSSSPISSR